jgi:hypothetical protein
MVQLKLVCHAEWCAQSLSSGIKSFTYHLIPDHGRSRDWALAKWRYRSEDLDLIMWDVPALLGRLRF